MSKFELIRFAIRSDRTVFEQGRFDCINGKFDTKEFMDKRNGLSLCLWRTRC